MRKPAYGERWAMKSDPSKVLKVLYCNSLDIVGFDAPWFKRHPKSWATLKLETFTKRYERVNHG